MPSVSFGSKSKGSAHTSHRSLEREREREREREIQIERERVFIYD
jgi:hypothetical protein